MQQRVGIARAFSIEPDVLLMDEPFSHLDAITSRTLRRELHELWDATGKTVLFVTHDVSEAVELSTRILLFAKGGELMRRHRPSTCRSRATPPPTRSRSPRRSCCASSNPSTWWRPEEDPCH